MSDIPLGELRQVFSQVMGFVMLISVHMNTVLGKDLFEPLPLSLILGLSSFSEVLRQMAWKIEDVSLIFRGNQCIKKFDNTYA